MDKSAKRNSTVAQPGISQQQIQGKKKYKERKPSAERSILHMNNMDMGIAHGHRVPHLCTMVPTDVPEPGQTQRVLHPRKDVFVLKVAKVGPNGDKKCKMELELVTPKYNDQPPVYRVDTRETQCEPECPCCCGRPARRKKRL